MGEPRIVPQAPSWRAELEIVSEIPSTLGLVLWQDLRHVRDWLEADSGVERAALFPPNTPAWVAAKRVEARTIASELGDALAVFHDLVGDPLAADPHHLAEACVGVAQWAEQGHHPETAMQFADAAACVRPDDPRLANLAGRISRNAAELARAEVWFERALKLARERCDRVELTRAHLGYGILCKELGRVRPARCHFERGANLARKAGFEWLAAEAQHDLFAYLLVRGRYRAAEWHARKAFALYPKHNRRLPFLAADFALLLVRVRRFTEAIRLLRPLLRTIADESARAVLHALLLRARAGLGVSVEVEALNHRARKLPGKAGEREAVVRWHLAAADHALGLWEAAESHAHAAIALATARHDRETARLAQALLDAIAARQPAPRPMRTADPQLAAFVDAMIRRLAEWSPTRAARTPRTLSRSEWAA